MHAFWFFLSFFFILFFGGEKGKRREKRAGVCTVDYGGVGLMDGVQNNLTVESVSEIGSCVGTGAYTSRTVRPCKLFIFFFFFCQIEIWKKKGKKNRNLFFLEGKKT
jgi:hypothetical protein